MILGKPKDGWVPFTLETTSKYSDLSYVTDIPVDWLDAAIYGLKASGEGVFTVYGLREPGRMICTVSRRSVYIINEVDTHCNHRVGECAEYYSMQHIKMNMLDFCTFLHHDIFENLDEWVNWSCVKQNEQHLEERRELLQNKLDELQALIKEIEEAEIRGKGFRE